MKIIKAYKTSKGVFQNKENAEKNKAKIAHSDRFDSWVEKEKVSDVWILVSDDNETFILNPVEVKE